MKLKPPVSPSPKSSAITETGGSILRRLLRDFYTSKEIYQNWGNAVTLINRIIASEDLSADDRTFYVDYRRKLLDYSDRNVRLETVPGCEEILETIEEISPPVPKASTPAIENSNFNWDQEISKIRDRSQVSNTPPATAVPSSSPINPTGLESGNSTSTSTEVLLQESQGVFFRPAPRSNIPAANIRGSIMSNLPIEAEDIVVHYDIYSLSQSDGANSSNVYTCSQTEQYRRVADKLSANAQASVFIEESDRFVQIVGITWREQGNRTFVRVSEFSSTQNVRPCSPWYPYYYYNYFDRQAVDPQIRLR